MWWDEIKTKQTGILCSCFSRSLSLGLLFCSVQFHYGHTAWVLVLNWVFVYMGSWLNFLLMDQKIIADIVWSSVCCC